MSGETVARIDSQASPGHDRGGYDRIEGEAAIETQVLETAESAREIAQAVSVAAAYFEDTLAGAPQKVISAGTLGAGGLAAVLEDNRLEGLRVQEMVPADALGAGVAITRIPRGWLAGVRGALRN
jgi:type IV pilus assembly protein PilM